MTPGYNLIGYIPVGLATLLLACCACQAAELVLVRADAVAPCIYVGAAASEAEKFAATELQTYIYKIAGRKPAVRIVSDGLRPTATYIAVGHSSLTAHLDTAGLCAEQYIVEVTTDHLAIAGASDRQRGVLYGVYDLLDGLGVRWYRPEPWGEYVPHMHTMRLPLGTQVSRVPDYEYRSVLGGGFTRHLQATKQLSQWASLWSLHNRLNGSDPGSDPRYGGQFKPQFGHIYSSLIPAEEYFDKHPDYFCLYNGERRPTGMQLCLGNPDLQDLFAQKIIEQARAAKDLNSTTFSVTPNDACPFCECDRCRAMDDPQDPTLMSNRVCAFTNIIARKVAQAVPGARVSLCVYSTWTAPPTIVKRLEPNICIHIALINEWADYTKPLLGFPPNWNQTALDAFRKWYQLGAQAVYTYEYWSGYAWAGPLPLVRTMADRVANYRQFNIRGIYNETSPHWGPQGLELYMCARLLWNPDLDVARELSMYYRNYYGPAARPMKAYHEALMDALASHPYPVFSGGRGMHLVFAPALVAQLSRNIHEAQALTKGQPLYERRLVGVEAGFEFARRVSEILVLKQRNGVKTDVGGVFTGRGSYMKSAEAETAYDELIHWAGSFATGDSVFDLNSTPERFWYLREDILDNAALSYLDEQALLAGF